MKYIYIYIYMYIYIGIIIKRDENVISYEKAVQYASLISDLWSVTRKVVSRDLKNPDVKI